MTRIIDILNGPKHVGNNYIVTKESDEGLLKTGYHILVCPNGLIGVAELHKFIIGTDVILYETGAEVELI